MRIWNTDRINRIVFIKIGFLFGQCTKHFVQLMVAIIIINDRIIPNTVDKFKSIGSVTLKPNIAAVWKRVQ